MRSRAVARITPSCRWWSTAPKTPRGEERIADIEPEMDGLYQRLTTLREMSYGGQCLLKVRHGFPEGRA